jgi:transposase
MRRYRRLLTEAQWQKIERLLPRPRKRPGGGLPPAANRRVLEGVLWILRSRARRQDLPRRVPPLRRHAGGYETGKSRHCGCVCAEDSWPS